MNIQELVGAVKKVLGRLNNEYFLRVQLPSYIVHPQTIEEKFGGDWKKAAKWAQSYGLLEDDIDKQCRDRFGRTWKQVRRHLFRQVQKIAYAPGCFMRADEAAMGMRLGNTRNWMTNRFLEVLYLNFLSPTLATELSGSPGETIIATTVNIESWAQDQIVQDLLKLGVAEMERELELHDRYLKELLRIAPILCPEEVRKVLESHDDVLGQRKKEV